MRIFAFIPARYGSTRFPGKPLALIAGRPLIEHVYTRAGGCAELTGVYVATDDERIAGCVRGFGGRVVMTDAGHRSGTDRICEAARQVGLLSQDLVINIQGDQPLMDPRNISLLIRPFLTEADLPMATLRSPITDPEEIRNPNHVKVVTDQAGNALYFSRAAIPFARDPESACRYYKHLGVYAYRMDFLERFSGLPESTLEAVEKLEQLRALEGGFRIRVLETELDSPEVDVPADIARVEAVLKASSM